MSPSHFNILIAEDNPTDVMVMREALSDHAHRIELHAVNDGVQALEFLQRQGAHAQAPRPDLILLDLNMPRKGGLEVLREIKADAALCAIPVVVLSTSQAPEDLRAAYQAHANCYIRKPMDFHEFSQVVQGLEQFWCHVVTLPHA